MFAGGRNQGRIIEIKDTKKLYNTPQIQAQYNISIEQGKQYIIVTGENTHVSNNVLKDKTVTIERKDYLGPQH